MAKERWDSLDFLKGIACIAVVFIHFNFPGNFGIAVKSICRIGVPVFFTISGLFFLQNRTIDCAKTVKKIRHIMFIILGASLFYAGFTLVFYKLTSENWSIEKYVEQRFLPDKIIRFFIENGPFGYSHLWFLLALLYCYLFCMLFFSNGKLRLIVNISIIPLLIIYSCLQEFNEVLGIQSSVGIPGTDGRIYLFNIFIFRALPFFLLGMWFSLHQKKIDGIYLNTKVLWVFIFIGEMIAIFERFHFKEAQFYIGTYISVFCMFLLAIKEKNYGSNILKFIGKNLSMYIYILHIAIGRIIDVIANELGVKDSIWYSYSKAIIILFLSLVFSFFIFRVKSKFVNISVKG